MSAGTVPALRIYTDASYAGARKGKIGAWGAVLVWGENDHSKHGAQFRLPCQNSATAELFAIANGLAVALRSKRLCAGMSIEVFSDCDSVVAMIANRKRARMKTKERFHDGLAEIDRLVAALCMHPISFHWVKGHQPDTSGCPHAPFNRLAHQAAVQANPHVKTRAQKSRDRRRKREAIARAREALANPVTEAQRNGVAKRQTSQPPQPPEMEATGMCDLDGRAHQRNGLRVLP